MLVRRQPCVEMEMENDGWIRDIPRSHAGDWLVGLDWVVWKIGLSGDDGMVGEG